MPRSRVPTKPKVCAFCGVVFERRDINGRLEDRGVYERRKFCSLSCANSRVTPGHASSYHLRAKKYLKAACEACRTTDALHVHHVDHDRTNNTPENCQTLCAYCHLFWHWTYKRNGWSKKKRMPSLVELRR